MHIVCPACGTTNRVPDDSPRREPVCGRCGAELAAARPAALSDATFDRYIGRNDPPVLVDFWAEWCGPCKMMGPHFEAAAAQVPEVRFAKLDIDANPRAAQAHAIRSVPTLVLYRAGRELARQSGVMAPGVLTQWLRHQLNQSE
ncbi:thioredoxin [Parapusillimonas granuli]|uniref:Thioredoxin n=1 Tax=Parapusillimonas granuli TaxID=380911 RepID=A0A853G166_9BURK|nr:thioredoxin [Parapusillimonas granuli]MBB5213727.1 thioredoxin 2 [Parapusillimonas granuli]NYT48561.1 thioredoxin [Parapusillimonas granuli]